MNPSEIRVVNYVKLDGESICTSKGRYYLKKFNTIPVDFVLKMYFNKAINDIIYQYALDNLDMLLDMAKTTHIKTIVDDSDNDCIKIKYMSKSIANLEMKRIQGHISGDYKPIRSYFCDNCGMWHLTSKKNYQIEIYEKSPET